MKKFILEIELSNDAMQTPSDVAGVLHDVADRIDRLYDVAWHLDESIHLRDKNGNTVGKAAITETKS